MSVELKLYYTIDHGSRLLEFRVLVDGETASYVELAKEDILWLLNQDSPPPSL